MQVRYAIPLAIVCVLLTMNGLIAQQLMPSEGSGHNKVLLNGTWKFKYYPSTDVKKDSLFYEPGFDVGQWPEIKVPGNWELQGFAEPVYGKNINMGTGLYRTGFTVPVQWKANPVYIAFDGVQFGYSFWVNGRYAGQYAGSFNRRTFDISSFVIPGKLNSLAVKVITHPKGWEFDTNDDWSLCGIFRDVTLFNLPPVHLKDLTVKTFVANNKATISLKALIEKAPAYTLPKNVSLSARLLDPSGKVVRDFLLKGNAPHFSSDTSSFSQLVTLNDPLLWTAETPHLYTLSLILKENNRPIQQYTEYIGIREVSWANGILRLNGTPIKLRGANHHDLSPVNGRAITEAEIRKDLMLMYEANINFIRTSHYPPNQRLLDLCDSLGFYVMDEVPFGYGDEHLDDSSYLPVLKERAHATIWRDKNHPCIIAWSVGNENPVTDIGLTTGRYVKTLDNTRPYCFPQTLGEFQKMQGAIADSVDMLDDHYPSVANLDSFAKMCDRPVIAGEYAHALGLDFGTMESIYETMYVQPKLAGGAVWEFFDQGILRKAPGKITKHDPTLFAWPNRDSIYDTGGNNGTDGIVYANRVPQIDYWQVRKVYAPVKALDDTLTYRPGKQVVQIKLLNRYDFTNLSAVGCQWQLFADTILLSSGEVSLQGKPHDTTTLSIPVVLPERPLAKYYYIKLFFKDSKRYQFYEKTYLIKSHGNLSIGSGITATNVSKPVRSGDLIETSHYRFEWMKDPGMICLKNKDGNVLIAEGPYARAGRKPTITQDATASYKTSAGLHSLWSPFLLSKPEIQVQSFDDHKLVVQYRYMSETPGQGTISGDIEYDFTDSGSIHVRYRLVPEGNGQALETGISFLIPETLSEFRWIGKGPYAAYPGKDRLSEFGFYHLNSNDLYFAGNRQQVDAAIFSDDKGTGFALIANDANIAVERTTGGIVVSHNAYVSGRFNKHRWPLNLYSFKEGREIAGSFTLVPLTFPWPKVLTDIFGDATGSAIPFQPFFHSYDQ